MSFLNRIHNGAGNYAPRGSFSINKASPQARGLVGWWPTFDGSFQAGLGISIRNMAVPYAPDALPFDATPTMTIVNDGAFSAPVANFAGGRFSDYFNVAAGQAWMGDDLPHTISCWAKVTDNGDPRWGLMSRDDNFSGINLYFEDATKAFRHSHGTWNTDVAEGTNGKNFDQWYFVVGTSPGDTGTIRIYVDGIEEGTDTAGNDNQSAAPLHLGSADNGGREFNGAITDWRWYDRVLTPGEIWAMYEPSSRWDLYQPISRIIPFDTVAAAGGRIMSSLTNAGGLAGRGGIAGQGGGLAG